jgi:hypothetical protein
VAGKEDLFIKKKMLLVPRVAREKIICTAISCM